MCHLITIQHISSYLNLSVAKVIFFIAQISLIECRIITCWSGKRKWQCDLGLAAALTHLSLTVLFLSRGNGQHGDPRGAQHPHDGGPGLHRHQLARQPRVSGLLGCEPLPPLEGSPAGLVCRGGTALLYAHRRCGAQLRSAGKPGGVPEGRGLWGG